MKITDSSLKNFTGQAEENPSMDRDQQNCKIVHLSSSLIIHYTPMRDLRLLSSILKIIRTIGTTVHLHVSRRGSRDAGSGQDQREPFTQIKTYNSAFNV